MISLELAEKMNIVNAVETKKILQKKGVTYIGNTYSSYNYTHLTLGSFMALDYLFTEKNIHDKSKNNRNIFFPLVIVSS